MPLSLPLRRLPVGRTTADFFCSPHPAANLDPLPAVLESFQQARSTILFSIYAFTSADILQGLVDAHLRGVQITGVVDRGQATGPYAKAATLVSVTNGAAKVAAWNGSGLMHDKAFVVDRGRRAGLGSYNWTDAAEKRNTEVLLITRGRPDNPLATALTDAIMTAYLDATAIG